MVIIKKSSWSLSSLFLERKNYADEEILKCWGFSSLSFLWFIQMLDIIRDDLFGEYLNGKENEWYNSSKQIILIIHHYIGTFLLI